VRQQAAAFGSHDDFPQSGSALLRSKDELALVLLS
jgi:hypothetical protein